MIKSAMVALACPLGNHKVSFRLVDEHGSGRPFAGLPYRLHDSRGQTLTGNLDSDGFAQIVNLHCGPQVLDLSDITAGPRVVVAAVMWRPSRTTMKRHRMGTGSKFRLVIGMVIVICSWLG